LIAVTGNAHTDDIRAFKDAGVDSILLKPVARAVLQQTLKEYLPGFTVATSAAQIKMRQAMGK
jgi:CheY-like chemotaxis protein